MTEATLYYGPGACSRVTMVALEEIGLSYEAVSVDLRDKAGVMQAYRAINPNAEVPALRLGGRTFTQNAAILHYLASQYPEARLLPAAEAVGANAALEDLIWCSSSLHIMRRQILNPPRFTHGEVEGVRSKGVESWQPALARIAERLSRGAWWYGDEWSIVDTYVNWTYTGSPGQVTAILEEQLGLTRWPALAEHGERVRSRPSFVRAIERERTGRAISVPST